MTKKEILTISSSVELMDMLLYLQMLEAKPEAFNNVKHPRSEKSQVCDCFLKLLGELRKEAAT